MRFRKNIIPLGSSRVSSGRVSGDRVNFYLAGEGVVVKKSFDLSAHVLSTEKGCVAYADCYLALNAGAVVDLGELVYEEYN